MADRNESRQVLIDHTCLSRLICGRVRNRSFASISSAHDSIMSCDRDRDHVFDGWLIAYACLVGDLIHLSCKPDCDCIKNPLCRGPLGFVI